MKNSSFSYQTLKYVYNGLGYLVKNIWTIKENTYGYTGITTQQIETSLGELMVLAAPVTPYPANSKNKKDKTLTPAKAQGNGNGNLNKTSGVTKNYVLDYTSPLKNTIMESETLKAQNGQTSAGFTYRYIYGLEKLSVRVSPVTIGS